MGNHSPWLSSWEASACQYHVSMTTPDGRSELDEQLDKLDQMAARAVELSPYAEDEVKEIHARHRRDLIAKSKDEA